MSTTTASTSVKVTFYNTDGTLNTNYSGRLADNRSSVSLVLNGSANDDVLHTFLLIDSGVATTDNRKKIRCQMGSTTTVEQGTYSELDTKYPFVHYTTDNHTEYSLRCRIVLNDQTNLDAKFTISGKSLTPSYKYRYTTVVNTFLSATVTNPAQIENGSTILISAPMDYTINPHDTEKPVKILFTFEVVEEEGDTDNLEALVSYSAVKPYSDTGNYSLENNQLTNGYLYAMSVDAVYADGFTTSINATDFFQVVAAPVISLVSGYGLGLDYKDAGVAEISSVMDVTMETHINITSDEKILFKLSQDDVIYYTYEVRVKPDTNPTYYITYSDLVSTNIFLNPAPTTEGGKTFYRFDVTAERSYNSGALVKVSDVYSENFTLDITPLAAVSVANQWTALGLVGSSRTVALDSELTQAKFNSISETGYAGKFSKTTFFGTGKTGLYADLDTSSTKFKIEASVNGGTSFAPVTSLRMKQGSLASSAAVDRAVWMDLLDDTPITNVDGLYDNIPWPTEALGTAQPPMYILGDYSASDSSIPGIYSLNGVRTNYADANMTSVKADSTLIVETITNKDGWLIKNGANLVTTVNGVIKTTAPKVNLYYYINPVDGYIPATTQTGPVLSKQTAANSFTLNQASGLGLYAVFNQNAGAKRYPAFIVYTTQTGSGDKKSWYKSNVVLGLYAGGRTQQEQDQQQQQPGLTLAYTGTDDLSFRPDIPVERRAKYDYKPTYSVANADYASEFVKFLTLQTSSNAAETNAGDFDFQLLETGMFTSHASTGLVSLTYNEYSRLLELRVSIVADRTTSPGATPSNLIRVMNKVNTPTGQNAYYSIQDNKLYVVVNNNFSSSNDKLTGVLFTSNLASPNDRLFVPLPVGNTTNQFTFEVASPELRGSANPVKFQIAHTVNDENGGDDITGLPGPETSVECYNAPTRANFAVSRASFKTVSQHGVSSAEFNFSMNTDDNISDIYGLRVYFSADGVSSILVDEFFRAAVSPREIILSNKSFYSEWTDRTVGTLTFVPLYYDKNANGVTTWDGEASLETRGFTLRKVDTLPVVVPSLKGGIVQDSTVLIWTSVPGYDYFLTEGIIDTDLSEEVVSSSSYTMAANTLTAGTEKILGIGKTVTLTAVSATDYFQGLPEETYIGPRTIVTFTPVSVNPSTMAISVLQGSNDDDLVASFVAPVVSGNTGNQLNMEKMQLGKAVSGNPVFSALIFVADSVGTSTSNLQTAAESNKHNIEAEPISTLLELQVQVVAGIDYTVKVGSATAVGESSESVALRGPSKAYRVAGPPATSSNGNNYTVINGNITIPLNMDANGMAPEGLSNAFAFITQKGDFTISDGDGATVFCLWSVHSARTYAVGTDAVSSNTSDSKLAPGEIAITTPMDLVNGVNAIEVGSYKLTIGNLTSSDSSSISFPSTGFNTSKEIGVTFVAQTRLGYSFVPFTVSPPQSVL